MEAPQMRPANWSQPGTQIKLTKGAHHQTHLAEFARLAPQTVHDLGQRTRQVAAHEMVQIFRLSS